MKDLLSAFLERERERQAVRPKLYWAIDPHFEAEDEAAAYEFLALLREDPRSDRDWVESLERMRVGLLDRGLKIPKASASKLTTREWVQERVSLR